MTDNQHHDPFVRLADEMVDLFTPYAFLCDCEGKDPDCHRTRTDTYALAQHETVQRIQAWILRTWVIDAKASNAAVLQCEECPLNVAYPANDYALYQMAIHRLAEMHRHAAHDAVVRS